MAQDKQQAQEAQGITIDTSGYNPATDPGSPEFDIAAWAAAVDDMGGIPAAEARLKAAFADPAARARAYMGLTMAQIKQLSQAEQSIVWREMAGALDIKGIQSKIKEAAATVKDVTPSMKESVLAFSETVRENAQAALAGITAIMQSEGYRAFKESIAAISLYLERHRLELQVLADLTEDVQELAPYLKIEFEAAEHSPELEGMELSDLFKRGFDAEGNPTDSPFKQIIERAKQRKAEFEDAEGFIADIEQAEEELPRIISHPSGFLSYPLDKPNSRIWNLLAATEANGQLSLDIHTEGDSSKRKGKEAIVFYSISFDALETSGTGVKITKTLTPFDKRVYIAAAALYNAGNQWITATQIYKMMGNRGQPNAADVKKINASLDKMGAARVYIDSTQEVKVNKGYAAFKWDASLLPFERMSAYINNTLAESAIHLFREPPLITFARERKQVTRVARKLLESPISKTDANLMIEDYLIERISHMKNNPRLQRKILFVTIYERCKITNRLQRSRTPDKITRLLDWHKQCNFIKGYTVDADGITIAL